MKRILCIDGGGIRGVMPAAFLERVERETSRRTANIFDLISGASTGGLIALYLTVPRQDGAGPAHSAMQLRRLYTDHAQTIFPQRWWKRVSRLWSPKYSPKGLRHVITDRLRDAKISDLVTPVVIPSFDRLSGEETVFKPGPVDWHARDVALATSAAPTFFPAHSARSVCGSMRGSYLDGGIWANNPALCAYAEAKRLWPEERIAILSLGTGRRRNTGLGPSSGGLAQWAPALPDLFMDSGERGIDYQIRAFVSAAGDRYERVQTSVPADLGMDSTNPDHLSLLCALGQSLADDYLAGGA